MKPMPTLPFAPHLLRWLPTLLLSGASSAWAALPPGVTTVVLSEPSTPSSASSYSTARYDGPTTGNEAGRSLSASGDFNGDGIQDLAIGAPAAASSLGSVFVVFGQTTGPTKTISLSSAVQVSGVAAGDVLGASLAAADFTGDGKTDLAIGAPGVSGGKGAVYIIPGGTSWSSGTVSAFTGVITVSGETASGRFGAAIAAGDVTGDGSALTDGKVELLASAPPTGKVYMVYGPVSTGAVLSSSSTNAYNYTFYGNVEDSVGSSIAMTGDMNNDGSRDFVIGGSHGDTTSTSGNVGGVAYLVNGRSRQSLTSSGITATMNLNGTASKKRIVISDVLYGTVRVGQLGAAVAGGMDLNGDGFPDAVFGAPTAPRTTTSTPEAGRFYVVFGGSTVFDTSSSFLSSSGFPYYYGETAYDRLGSSLSTAGDVDANGYADLLVGAFNADLSSSTPGDAYGAAYLVSGRLSSSWPTSGDVVVSLSALKFLGKYRSDFAGSSVAGAPGLDLNHDGYGDFYIGAPGYNVSSTGNEGRVYIIGLGDFYDKDGDGQSLANADCNEADNAVYYTSGGENEVCDGKDNDCDLLADDADTFVADQNAFYLDTDNDGFGGSALLTCAADAPDGYILVGGDCDDDDSTVNPNATEICDGVDNECDGQTDDNDDSVADQNTFYRDLDGDGYGSASSGLMYGCSSEPIDGYSLLGTDCDDSDTSYSPAAPEYCDNIDTNCNGVADDDAEDGVQNYADTDGDGYGDPNAPERLCEPQSGFVLNAEDCDDTRNYSYPGATERCDGYDNSCDGAGDDTVAEFDQDNDGYLDEAQCAEYGTTTGDALDCDDGDSEINPDADEMDDSVDNDCDGRIDENVGCSLALSEASSLRAGNSGKGALVGVPGLTLLAVLAIRRRRSALK